MRKGILITGAILLITAFVLFTPNFLTPYPDICTWDFRNCLWGPVNMLVHGQSPYSTNTPFGPYSASWLPMAMGAFFYIGWLPCIAASKIWFLMELGGLGLMIWLLWDRTLPSPRMLLAILLAIFLFPPLYMHFHNGQFTIFFMTLMMISVFLPGARRWRPLLLAIGLTKPQLGFLIYPGLLIAEYRKYGLKSTAKLFFETVACTALLTLPLFLVRPGWPVDFVNSLSIYYENTTWDTPTLYAQLPVMLGSIGFTAWVVIFLIVLGLSFSLWWRGDSQAALVWTMAMTPLVTPYTWSYDFIMLFPVLIWLLHKESAWTVRAVLLGGAFLVNVGIVASRWKTNISDGLQWWIPALMLSIILFSQFVKSGVKRLVPFPRSSH